MLHDFLTANRAEIVNRCKVKGAERRAPKTSRSHLEFGIPHFLDQVILMLQADAASKPSLSAKISGYLKNDSKDKSKIGVAAAQHGRELSEQGFTFNEVVHDYGDLCQAITGLAVEKDEQIEANEFKTLNRCLDNATADAVSEFARQHAAVMAGKDGWEADQRLQVRAQEMRKHIETAILAIEAIKTGNVGLNGVTGRILDLSLVSMRNLMGVPLASLEAEARAQHDIH